VTPDVVGSSFPYTGKPRHTLEEPRKRRRAFNETYIYSASILPGMTTDTATLNRIYEELLAVKQQMVRREDIEAVLDTPLIRSNRQTMRTLAESRRDVKAGRVRTITGVNDLLR
jgi:hypothetical protein